MPSLPLFPLGACLFPGSRLPLQVFEPRYVELLDDLLHRPEEERCFGVVAIRRGHEVGVGRAVDLHGIGTEARIDAVAGGRQDGMPVYQLVATGTRRFRLEGIDESAGTAYTTGVVSWLDEGDPDPAELTELTARLRPAHTAYRRAIGADPALPEEHPRRLAYAVAEHVVLDLADRQRVLEAPDAAARLRLVLDLLRRESGLVDRFHALPGLAPPGGAGLN